ncbi:MAG: thioredoxin domain-containing protein [Pseudomonadota bacterium]
MNHLSDTTSPYLLQHADNPVEWWPWCDEALQLARRRNKPILLSIGYSACHWCHVMAHESFEDEETAELMNRLFINIKVDREERPDLDRIYQQAHQLLSQRPGGWPLTVFLAPDDLMPFFAGTYFPATARYGMISFRELMQRIDEAWSSQQQAIRDQNRSLSASLAQMHPAEQGAANVDDGPLRKGRQQLVASFDNGYGGFGQAPKFPHATHIEFLLRAHARNPDDREARDMALMTLQQMALGGLYDQLGGGFCRYSTDDQWMIPHFEKMLYDNGPLLALAADAWRISGKPLFARVCEQTANWVMREMQSPEGGYYSTLDADSEGEEGKFYVWTPAEVEEQLNAQQYQLFAPLYGLDREANFEGRWHLHTFADLEQLAAAEGLSLAEAQELIDAAQQTLFAHRSIRIHPGRDEKILTSWNALMIKGMARAGRLCSNPSWIASAEQALAFIHSTLWREQRLLATYKDGCAHLNAYLDDYAFLIDALLELLQVRWNRQDFDFAIELADILLEQFEDEEQGGFFFTSNDHEQLIHRPKPMSDDSMPSGNGIAAFALQRLGCLLGDLRYLQTAERTLHTAWSVLSQQPHGHGALLLALEEQLKPPEILIARGSSEQLAEWQSGQQRSYRPASMVLAIPDDADVPQALADKKPRPGGVIYRCRGTQCETPEPME